MLCPGTAVHSPNTISHDLKQIYQELLFGTTPSYKK